MRIFTGKGENGKGEYENVRTKLEDMELIFQQMVMIDRAQSMEDMQKAINTMLRVIGDYTNSERVYIFDANESGTAYRHAFEWCSAGVTPQIDKLQSVEFTDMPYWQSVFERGGSIVIKDIENIKSIMPSEYDILKVQNIKTLIAFPIFSRKSLSGFIGLDNPEMQKSELFIHLLAVVGGHLGSARENFRMGELLKENRGKLDQSLEALEKDRQVLAALCMDYTSVYYVDLASATFEIFKLDNVANAIKFFGNDKDEYDNVSHDYQLMIRRYYDTFVVKENSPDFLEKLSIKNIMRELSSKERFVYHYQSVPNPQGHEYFDAVVSRPLGADDPYRVIIGFRHTDELLKERQKHQRELEDALAEAKLNNEIISSISRIYFSIYRIDLRDDFYEEISSSNDVHRLTGHIGRASSKMMELCDSFVSPDYRERVRKFFDLSDLPQRMKNDESVAIEYLANDGNWHMARFIEKKRDENGELTNVLYVTRLISDMKRREYNWMVVAEEANRANEEKSDFLSRMSHDLRTPLNAVMGLTQVAEDNIDDGEKVKECLLKINRTGKHLHQLISNILDISDIESGSLRLHEDTVDIDEMVADFKVDAENVKSYRDLEFIYNVHDIMYHKVVADGARLEQIYMNLLSNAVKYTPDGGSIKLGVFQQESAESGKVKLVFVIGDTGTGMSEEFMKKMYSKFTREIDTRLNTVRGSGLGLAIVKQLVDMMHGNITVKSEIGKGTEFTITLEFPYADGSEPAPGAGTEASGEFKPEGINILIAEDNDLNYEVASEMLAARGIHTERAEDGAVCVEKFNLSADGTYDAILMDMHMPVMDGIEASRMIRKLNHPQAHTIPVIAMTANVFAEDIEKCLSAGMNDHMPKPVDVNNLIELLRKYIK